MTANPKSTLGRGKSHKCFKISDEYCSLRKTPPPPPPPTPKNEKNKNRGFYLLFNLMDIFSYCPEPKDSSLSMGSVLSSESLHLTFGNPLVLQKRPTLVS